MSAPKILIAVGVAALLSTLPYAKPNAIRIVNLSEVLNKTVCPIRVEIDEDIDRIPRLIKQMKCAKEPDHWCKDQDRPKYECCQHHLMECVEMRDTVKVYRKSTKVKENLTVAVGCSCLVSKTTSASEIRAN